MLSEVRARRARLLLAGQTLSTLPTNGWDLAFFGKCNRGQGFGSRNCRCTLHKKGAVLSIKFANVCSETWVCLCRQSRCWRLWCARRCWARASTESCLTTGSWTSCWTTSSTTTSTWPSSGAACRSVTVLHWLPRSQATSPHLQTYSFSDSTRCLDMWSSRYWQCKQRHECCS